MIIIDADILMEMSIVQAYINHMKGVTVEMKPPENIRQRQLLRQMYYKALETLDSIRSV